MEIETDGNRVLEILIIKPHHLCVDRGHTESITIHLEFCAEISQKIPERSFETDD